MAFCLQHWQCPEGYFYDCGASACRVCNVCRDDHPNECSERCSKFVCKSPPTISNGYHQRNELGSRTFYICSKGFRLKNHLAYYLDCEDGSWSGEMPVCESEDLSTTVAHTSQKQEAKIIVLGILLALLVFALIGALVYAHIVKRRNRSQFKGQTRGCSIEDLSILPGRTTDVGTELLAGDVAREPVQTILENDETINTLLPESDEIKIDNPRGNKGNIQTSLKDNDDTNNSRDVDIISEIANNDGSSDQYRNESSKSWQSDEPNIQSGSGYSADQSDSNKEGTMLDSNDSDQKGNVTDTPVKGVFELNHTGIIENGQIFLDQ